jgi:hypothetical protein
MSENFTASLRLSNRLATRKPSGIFIDGLVLLVISLLVRAGWSMWAAFYAEAPSMDPPRVQSVIMITFSTFESLFLYSSIAVMGFAAARVIGDALMAKQDSLPHTKPLQ